MAKQTKNNYFGDLNYIFLATLTLTLALLPHSSSAFNLSLASSLSIIENCPVTCHLPATTRHTCGENNQISLKYDSESGNCLPDNMNYRIKTVVIDPGHGGHDKGCSGAHSHEKHIALDIAKKLGVAIRSQYPSIKVMYTRTTDKFVPLHERARLANRHQADLFISIHCNYVGASTVHGSETYVMGLHRADDNLAVAKRENAAIYLEDNYKKNYDYDPDSPEGHILLSMFQNAHLEQSISFAEKVEQQFITYVGRKSRGVKQAGFLVLRETTMPSVLIEAGFLSNSREEAYLRSARGQQYMANAIFRAFGQYKKEVEQGSSTAPPVYNASPAVAKAPTNQKIQVVQRQPITTPSQISTSAISQTPQTTTYTNSNTSRTYLSTSPYPTTSAEILVSKGDDFISQTIEKTLTGQHTNNNHSTSTTQNSRPATHHSKLSIEYAVQLAASTTPLNTNTARWQNAGAMIEIVREAEYLKYQVRHFSSFSEAENVRLYLHTRGFNDCFVVAYQDGIRIDVREARKLMP